MIAHVMGGVKRLRTAKGVADWRLCLGCGACAYICPQRKIKLVDVVAEGIRPLVSDEDCGDCQLCLLVCPSLEHDDQHRLDRPGTDADLAPDFGPVLEVWEGHASDAEVRHRGSSGGAITALALHCIQSLNMHGALHLQPDPADAIRNHTWLSRSRSELLSGTGSRYAPGSVCDGLARVETAPAPCVFIGQPCEVTALRKAQELRPALREAVGVAISFFCAGTPATQGTIELLRAHGLEPKQVEELRYRGLGWPGTFAVRPPDQTTFRRLATYEASWGSLQRFRPYGVYLFPDCSGEAADISCADAWHRPDMGNEGYSLVVVRTERGRQVLRSAIQDGALLARRVDAARLLHAQQSLVGKRGVIWGRVQTFRLLGLPAPRMRGLRGAAAWWKLPIEQKVRSTLGTARRILQRQYYRPLKRTVEASVGNER